MNPVTQTGPESHQVEGRSERPGRITLLVDAAARGNQSAWEGLVNEFSRVVLGVARSHGLSEADVADVAQTTWLRLVENLPRIQDPERIGAWLATTAARESARVAQKARKQIVTDEVPERSVDDDVAQRVVNAERQTALRSAFRRLRRRDQALLGLLVADPAPSYEQIGRILHMPVGSIGPTRARSLTRLRREAALFGIEELTPSTRRM
ncbi:MAG TPA: sigma-70 family RNA polymerase sigma factor [Gemmatimonadales bacterium]|nr:sigma-70 family RNA polymerase sigma factor [Gemmatimonadales bacterium]